MLITGSACLLLGAVLGIAVVYLAPPFLIREEDDEKNKKTHKILEKYILAVETKDKSTLTPAKVNHGNDDHNTVCGKDKVTRKDKSTLATSNEVFNGNRQVDGIEQVNSETEQINNENTLDSNITEQDNNGNTQFVNRSEQSDKRFSENERIRQILENVQSEISREWNADTWTFVVPSQSREYASYYDADSHISTPCNRNILVLSNFDTMHHDEDKTEYGRLKPTQPPAKKKKTTHKIYTEIRYSSSLKNNGRSQNKQQQSTLTDSKNQKLIEIEESNIVEVKTSEADLECNTTPVKKKGNVVVRLKRSKSPLRRVFRTVMSTLHFNRSAHRKAKFLNAQNNKDNNNNENCTNKMDKNDNNNNSISHITTV